MYNKINNIFYIFSVGMRLVSKTHFYMYSFKISKTPPKAIK